jgi:putative ABC transport system permease protein
MSTLIKDIRYAVRMLLRSPGFTIVAVLALALGIGANTAIFSVVNAILLRSLPFRDPSSLVMVWEKSKHSDRNVVSPANYLDWKSRNHVFGDLAAVISPEDFHLNLTGAGEPEELPGGAVSANFFQMIGVQPIIGRSFLPGEDTRGRDRVAIVSHQLWRRRFGSNVGIVGKSITLSGELYQVIGILPPDFLWNNRRTDVWVLYVIDPGRDYRATSGRYMDAVGRLKPDVTLQQAQAEMSEIARQLEGEHPEFNKNWGVNLVPLHEQTVGQVRPALLVLLASVAFVLLIACVNVANLLLARAAARQREIAVRAALGAGRWRLVRQLLTESTLLAACGGLLGLLLSSWGIEALVALAPASIPRLSEIRIDKGVFAFTALVSLATGILFGLAPAIEISKVNLNDALKEGGRTSTGDVRRHRVRGALVISEVALALVLLIGAGLMIRSFERLGAVNPGFRPDHLLTMKVLLTGTPPSQDQPIIAFFREAVERLGRLPGVRSAGAINYLPLSTGMASATSFTIVGQPDPGPGNEPGTDVRVVDPNYFRTMGIPLLQGRGFTAGDTQQSARVLIVSETLAHRYFPGENPVGKKLVIWWGDDRPDEIVGVAGDILHEGLDARPEPMIYWPEARMPYNSMTLVARTEGDPMSIAPAAIKEIHAMRPDQPVADVRSMNAVEAESVSRQRFNMLLLAIFAAVALLLAVVGIYGVMAYGVTERTHEIGIRVALGAGRGDVLRAVMGRGLVLTIAGVGIGAVAAYALTRLMTSLLFGVRATDPATFAGVALLLAMVALAACYVPAWRATKVDPMVALRYE